MTVKNYKNNQFEQDQPLSYTDLNNLSYNDQLLYEYINPKPRGILAFIESSEDHASGNPQNVITPTNSQSDPLLNGNYKSLNFYIDSTWSPASLTCTLPQTRLTRINFYSGIFTATNIQQGAAVRLGVFYKYEDNDIELLSSNTKITSFSSNLIRQRSLTMQHSEIFQAGTYQFFIGVKVFRCEVKFSDSVDSNKRPMQFYIEDLGFPFDAERQEFTS